MIRSALFGPILALLLAMTMVATAASTPAPAAAEGRAPDIELKGELSGGDNHTWLALPFQVPAGVERITVEFAYTGREDRTTIDLGLFDPFGFRGWSGGNKSRFTLSRSDATPSYLPGALPPGEWRLQLSIPNIRPRSRSSYAARIWFDQGGGDVAPLRSEAGWYRGDFHVHSGHSDGVCRSQKGVSVPCPVFRLLQEATARGLDFVALTDHNTTSHFQSIRELQPWFDRLLVLPGQEVTTFQGHLNLLGPTTFVDFRLGSGGVADADTLLRSARASGGLVIVNHPALPSGESCMGCGWTAPTDWSRVDAIEVVNGGAVSALGGAAETFLSGVPFWEGLLNRGFRISAIGGSDSHDPDRPAGAPGALGRPTTVVYAQTLSQADLYDGVKTGRAFVDVEGSGAGLSFTANAGGRTYAMGDAICARRGDRIQIVADPGAPPGGVVEIVASPNLSSGRIVKRGVTAFVLTADGAAGWVRANVRRASDNRLLVLGNPIYLVAKGC